MCIFYRKITAGHCQAAEPITRKSYCRWLAKLYSHSASGSYQNTIPSSVFLTTHTHTYRWSLVSSRSLFALLTIVTISSSESSGARGSWETRTSRVPSGSLGALATLKNHNPPYNNNNHVRPIFPAPLHISVITFCPDTPGGPGGPVTPDSPRSPCAPVPPGRPVFPLFP